MAQIFNLVKYKSDILEYSFIIIVFLGVVCLYSGQQRMTHNNGKGYDGYYYYEATQQIAEGNFRISGRPPFVNRYGNHLIIGLYARSTNKTILDSAFEVNMLGMFLTVLMLLKWLSYFLDKRWIRLLLVSIFTFTWFVPIRLLFFEPMVPDPWGSTFFIAGLMLLYKLKSNTWSKKVYKLHIILFGLVTAIGMLFRESNIVLAVALFFIKNPIRKLNYHEFNLGYINGLSSIAKQLVRILKATEVLYFLPLCFCIITPVLISVLITPLSEFKYSYITALVKWFYTKSLPEFITGVCIAYGPLIVLLVSYTKIIYNFFAKNEYLTVIILAAIFFGYFGGGDTERILFMSSFPIVYIVIGFSILRIYNSKDRWLLFIILFLQTFSIRIYWKLPDHPNEYENLPIVFWGLLGDKFQTNLLYSNYGNINLHTLLLLEYVCLLFITLCILKKSKTSLK